MKLSKGQGISLFAAIILFAIFNIIIFLSSLPRTLVFWLGYFFALFALITMVLSLVLYFGKEVKEEKFLNLSTVKMAWTYFVLQIALSAWEMISFPLSYMPVLIINLLFGAVFSVIILSLYASSSRIDRSEEFVAEKVIFIKELKFKLDSIETSNVELTKKVAELSENVRFSDPMSHSKLARVELSLSDTVDELVDNITDVDKAVEICKKVSKLLKERNEQCRMYKGVKDTIAAKQQKSNNGKSVALVGVGAALAMFLITLAVCFIVIPQSKYSAAKDLLEAEKYPEAIAAFEEIIDYRDSETQIEIAKKAILQQKYAEAIVLMEDKKYAEAIVIFTEIKDYEDSTEKITEIEDIIEQSSYDMAEEYFNTGNYSEAINIYSALGDFKDSKLRVEQIYNRLSDGDILYFGTYDNSPIAWKILKTEPDKMLLLAEKPIALKPFDDEIKKVAWETCDLRMWLNEDFMTSFSDKQQEQILVTATGDTTDKIFLLDVDEIVELAKKVKFATTEEWWTRTSKDNGIVYMSSKGWVQAKGDQIVRDKGVRPAIWISLK